MMTDQVQQGLVQTDTVLLEPFPWQTQRRIQMMTSWTSTMTMTGEDDNDDDDDSPEGDDDIATYEDDDGASLLVDPGLVEAAALLDGGQVLLLTPGGGGEAGNRLGIVRLAIRFSGNKRKIK